MHKNNILYECVSYIFQDIIENEDIKLDNMFITSLVHDLVRVSIFKQNK